MSMTKASGRKMINDKVKFLLEIVNDSTNHKNVKDTARSVLHGYGLTNADIKEFKSKKEFVDELFEDDYWKSGERYERKIDRVEREVERESMENENAYGYSVEKRTIFTPRKLIVIIIFMLITIVGLMIVVPVPTSEHSIRTEIKEILETTEQEGRSL